MYARKIVDMEQNKADMHCWAQYVLQTLCLHVCMFAAGDLSMHAQPTCTASRHGHWHHGQCSAG